MGACSCNEGWGGSDCSKALRGSGWLPQWLMYILMAASVLMSTVAWAVVHKIMMDWTERRRIAQEEASAALVVSSSYPVHAVYVNRMTANYTNPLSIQTR